MRARTSACREENEHALRMSGHWPNQGEGRYQKLRQLAGDAWEAELSMHLEGLLAQFHAWKEKHINAHDLSQKIHEFHDGLHVNCGVPIMWTAAEFMGANSDRKLVSRIGNFRG